MKDVILRKHYGSNTERSERGQSIVSVNYGEINLCIIKTCFYQALADERGFQDDNEVLL